MSKFELGRATDTYLSEHMEDHECGDGCDKGEGFFLLVHVENDIVHHTYGVHHLDPSSAIQAFVRFLDEQYIRNRPEGMPAALAFAHAREMIRMAAENIDPPAEVSQGLDEFLREIGSDDE